jgi:hypothetical protein
MIPANEKQLITRQLAQTTGVCACEAEHVVDRITHVTGLQLASAKTMLGRVLNWLKKWWIPAAIMAWVISADYIEPFRSRFRPRLVGILFFALIVVMIQVGIIGRIASRRAQ